MKINDNVLEILEEFKIRKDDGICYLLCLYYGYKPSYIPEDIVYKINASKIVENDGTAGLKWNIPLFEGQTTVWDWVETEYVALFEKVGKATHKREAVSRMKKLFAKHPEIRKEEVLGATELYLYNDNFPRFPHYFIEKGSGAEKTQDILDWIDKYRIANSQKSEQSYNTLE